MSMENGIAIAAENVQIGRAYPLSKAPRLYTPVKESVEAMRLMELRIIRFFNGDCGKIGNGGENFEFQGSEQTHR